jgi:hypothetical protein
VMAGGILPDEDIPAIEALGIKGNFGPGTSTQEIIDFVRANIHPERWRGDSQTTASSRAESATGKGASLAGGAGPRSE